MNDPKLTRVDRTIRWFKNNRFWSAVIFLALVIIALNTFTDSVRNLTKLVKGIFYKADIKISASVYLYERGFVLEGSNKTYFYEMRNLATNCSLCKIELKNLPRGRSMTPEPVARIILKFFIENSSETMLSNLRIGLRGLPFQFDKIICTPNVEASLKRESTSSESLSTQVIKISALPPAGKAVISLEIPVDRATYQSLVGIRLAILCPFITSDQLNISPPNIVKLNATEMLKRESELFTGERTFCDEKITGRILGPKEPSIDERYEPLPPAQKCPEGTGGNW